MTTDTRPAAMFLADAIGLDFLNTVATPVDRPVDWLVDGDDLLGWLEAARLVPRDVLAGLAKHALPGELDAVAAQARGLREWFRAFVRQHKGKPLGRRALTELEPLNRVLARDEGFGQIVARDADEPAGGAASGKLVWRLERRWRSAEALLLPIARAMADVICDDDFSLVKACEGAACTLWFVDRTRHHRRRWCSMSVCGNRAKQAAHRSRARDAT